MSKWLTIQKFAEETIAKELDYLLPLRKRIDKSFVSLIEYLGKSKSKIIVTGMGKSGFIAQKMSATLNSTGTLSCFLHASDALHGDLGIIEKGDTIIILSKSGETPEIKSWLPFILENKKNKIIAIVGNKNSYIAKSADWVLDARVEKEVCPLNLAPTTSAVAQLIWCDVIVTSLMHYKNISTKTFVNSHPGGMLGKKHFLTCAHLAKQNPPAYISPDTHFMDVLSAISRGLMGAVAVVNKQKKVLGIITDGDTRRALSKYQNILSVKASDFMTQKPAQISSTELAENIFSLFHEKGISQLILLDKKNNYDGMIHIHQLIKEGFSISQ